MNHLQSFETVLNCGCSEMYGFPLAEAAPFPEQLEKLRLMRGFHMSDLEGTLSTFQALSQFQHLKVEQ